MPCLDYQPTWRHISENYRHQRTDFESCFTNVSKVSRIEINSLFANGNYDTLFKNNC
jgi:hypothetical protein